MAKRKIRHALVQYVTSDGNFETAFRGMTVDIPADQVERLDSLGATVDPDDELERPGRMLTLPDTATDAEITSWVMGATNDEVKALVSQRPIMAARIEAAKAAVEERFQEQNLHLGELRQVAEQAEEDLIGTGGEAAPAATDGAPEDTGDGTVDTANSLTGPVANPAAEEALPAAEADQLVKGNAQTVAAFIAENPRTAAVVLEAEGRLAEKEKRDPRVSVVRAAEAAAGFTAQ